MANSKYRILVVEDNGVLQDVLKLNLERAGFEVITATNGRVALEALEREEFDLLLTDYQMPEVDGGELCRRVRDELRRSEMPIMMVSAKGLELDIDDLRERLRIGKVIFKPFSVRDIVSSAQQLCGSGAACVTT
jgi:CheY-like chemotaxis protein